MKTFNSHIQDLLHYGVQIHSTYILCTTALLLQWKLLLYLFMWLVALEELYRQKICKKVIYSNFGRHGQLALLLLLICIYRLAYSQGTRYRSQIYYTQSTICCSGYAGIPPNCPRKYFIKLLLQYMDIYTWSCVHISAFTYHSCVFSLLQRRNMCGT